MLYWSVETYHCEQCGTIYESDVRHYINNEPICDRCGGMVFEEWDFY